MIDTYIMEQACDEMLGAIESMLKALDGLIHDMMKNRPASFIKVNDMRKRLLDLQVDILKLRPWTIEDTKKAFGG